MPDYRRLTLLAVTFLVLLRIAIGWQFTYEGLWKLDTQKTAPPWTAAGYLKNAQGPLAPYFRQMVDDPHELDWAADADWAQARDRYYRTMIARWDDWRSRFLAHHPDLTDEQKQKLNVLLNGPEAFEVKLAELPEGVTFEGTLAKAVRYDGERKLLVVDGRTDDGHLWHLISAERDRLLRMEVPDEKKTEWQKAVRDLYAANAKLSYKERLAAHLLGDPEIVGDPQQQKIGELEVYRELLVKQQRDRAGVELAFQHAHLDYPAKKLAERRAAIAGPVRALDEQLLIDARDLLTPEQLARGPVPPANTVLRFVNLATMWGLLVLGVLLMLGLLTRFAAFLGAVMVFSFYLAMPPWPGVVEFQSFGPDHSYIVDKNLIEVLALLALAAMPSGKWFGVDAIFTRRPRTVGQSAGGGGPGGQPGKTPPPAPSKDYRQPVGSRR